MRNAMPFLVYCVDRPDGTALRRRTRAAHLAYMIAHKDKLLLGGPLRQDDGVGTSGSAFVIDLPDRDAIHAFLRDEPYARAGLFESVIVRRIALMVPEAEPGFLDAELEREREATMSDLRDAS
jgi:uncharacterized protein